jgi:hypothetical protein
MRRLGLRTPFRRSPANGVDWLAALCTLSLYVRLQEWNVTVPVKRHSMPLTGGFVEKVRRARKSVWQSFAHSRFLARV